MGNWSENQRAREKAEAKRDRRKEKIASLCFDLAKLCFGGMVVGAVVPIFLEAATVNRFTMGFFGLFTATMFIYVGNKFLK